MARKKASDVKRSVTAERIMKLRKGIGKTQEDLANDLGVSAGYIKKIELGGTAEGRNITPDKLRMISEYFECDPAYLTGESDYIDAVDRWRSENKNSVKRLDYQIMLMTYLSAVVPIEKIGEAYQKIDAYISKTVQEYGGDPAAGFRLKED